MAIDRRQATATRNPGAVASGSQQASANRRPGCDPLATDSNDRQPATRQETGDRDRDRLERQATRNRRDRNAI
jgi:hypothetical protein